MIYISSDSYDISTIGVIDWLDRFGADIVINNDDNDCTIEIISIGKNGTNIDFKIGEQFIDLKNVNSYWYRRGFNDISFPTVSYKNNYLNKFYNDEHGVLTNFMNISLEAKPKSIGKLRNNKVNKLHVLTLANQVGLSIPETIVCTKKSALFNFFISKKGQVITKALHENFRATTNKFHIYHYTIVITKQIIEDEIPSVFFPTLFQERVAKKIELRVFYLEGKFYSCAIFARYGNNNSVDFRNDEDNGLTRFVPYNLPKSIEEKLLNLMQLLDYESGSIDLIKTRENDYVFLEVNPIGQFGRYADDCNHHLEYEIAKTLYKNG